MIDVITILEKISLFIPFAAGWLLTYSIHSTLLLAMVWLATRLLHSHYQKLHDALWKAALAGALFTTTFQFISGVEPIAGRHTISTQPEHAPQLFKKLQQQPDFARQLKNFPDSCQSSFPEGEFYSITATLNDSVDFQWLSGDIKGLLPPQFQAAHQIDSVLVAAACPGKKISDSDTDTSSRVSMISESWNFPAGQTLALNTKQKFTPQPAQQIDSAIGQRMMMEVFVDGELQTDSVSLAGSQLNKPTDDFLNLDPNVQPFSYRLISDEFSWIHWMMIIWFAGVLFSAIRYWILRRQLQKLLAGRRPLTSGPVFDMLNDLYRASNMNRQIRLTASPGITSPVAFGYNEICIPERALYELNANQQRTMLAHELAHIVRRDPLWLAFTAALDVLFFFQPLNRLARKQLQETAEYLCDDWAVQHTGETVNLAKCLTQVAEWIRIKPQPAYVAGMACEGSALKRRVARILNQRPGAKSERHLRWISISAVFLLLLTAWCAPLISAEYMKTNMYVFYLKQAGVEKIDPAGSQKTQISDSEKNNETLSVQIRKGVFKEDFSKKSD